MVMYICTCVIKSMLFSKEVLQDSFHLCCYVLTFTCGGGRGGRIYVLVSVFLVRVLLSVHIFFLSYTYQLSPVSPRTSPLFPCLAVKGREGAGNVPRTINHLLFCELLRFLLGVVMAHWGSGWGSAPSNLSIDSVSQDVQRPRYGMNGCNSTAEIES